MRTLCEKLKGENESAYERSGGEEWEKNIFVPVHRTMEIRRDRVIYL